MKNLSRTLACALAFLATQAMAEKCLNTEKDKYANNDPRHADYIECPAAGETNKYGAIGAIGGILSKYLSDDTPSASQQKENSRAVEQYIAKEIAGRSKVRYGAAVEIGGGDVGPLQYPNANIPEAQKQALSKDLERAVAGNKLVETYGSADFSNPEAWRTNDPAARWMNCEVATRLARAYVLGESIPPEQKNPDKGLRIARTGMAQRCGGTAYWLGRIYESGDALVPGVDKSDLANGKEVKARTIAAYDVAIVNGFAAAHERMAELYFQDGPERYRNETFFSISEFGQVPYWEKSPKSHERFLMRVNYVKCLEFEPGNLPCARGLAAVYGNNFEGYDGYTDFNRQKATYFTEYAKKLETK